MIAVYVGFTCVILLIGLVLFFVDIVFWGFLWWCFLGLKAVIGCLRFCDFVDCFALLICWVLVDWLLLVCTLFDVLFA